MKQRTIKYKGLDLQLNIDVDSLVENVRGKYKTEISRLRKLLNKRDKYIHELHQKIKDKDSIMYMMLDGVQIYKKVKHIYKLNSKELFILHYLNSVNMSKVSIINEYFDSISKKYTSRQEMYMLIEKGYVILVDRYGYYAITDNGRRVINSIFVALNQDYTYFNHNRIAKKNRRIHIEGHTKYTPEERERRSAMYKKMMVPFWDSYIKMIPKDKKRRIEVIENWMAKQEAVDPYYYELIEKWSDTQSLI